LESKKRIKIFVLKNSSTHKYKILPAFFLLLLPTSFSSGAFLAACVGSFFGVVTSTAGARATGAGLWTGETALGGDLVKISLAGAGAGEWLGPLSGEIKIGLTTGCGFAIELPDLDMIFSGEVLGVAILSVLSLLL
jgi:hypothetical protein